MRSGEGTSGNGSSDKRIRSKEEVNPESRDQSAKEDYTRSIRENNSREKRNMFTLVQNAAFGSILKFDKSIISNALRDPQVSNTFKDTLENIKIAMQTENETKIRKGVEAYMNIIE